MASTIYDLAEAAGVSIATVSRALNDHFAVSEKTKERILKLAEEMDYRPNARARSFAKQRSGIVLFMGTPVEHGQIEKSFKEFIKHYELPAVVFHSLRHGLFYALSIH